MQKTNIYTYDIYYINGSNIHLNREKNFIFKIFKISQLTTSSLLLFIYLAIWDHLPDNHLAVKG